jgi:hypothetical protein
MVLKVRRGTKLTFVHFLSKFEKAFRSGRFLGISRKIGSHEDELI